MIYRKCTIHSWKKKAGKPLPKGRVYEWDDEFMSRDERERRKQIRLGHWLSKREQLQHESKPYNN